MPRLELGLELARLREGRPGSGGATCCGVERAAGGGGRGRRRQARAGLWAPLWSFGHRVPRPWDTAVLSLGPSYCALTPEPGWDKARCRARSQQGVGELSWKDGRVHVGGRPHPGYGGEHSDVEKGWLAVSRQSQEPAVGFACSWPGVFFEGTAGSRGGTSLRGCEE